MHISRTTVLRGGTIAAALVAFAGTTAYLGLHRQREVTTTSREAYAFYQEGMDARSKHYFPEAVQAWKQAVEKDSTFAMAWARLATYSASLGNTAEAREYCLRAVAHHDGVTGRERLLIAITDAAVNNRPAEKESLVTRLIEEYPDDLESLFRAAQRATEAHRHQDALAALRRIVEKDPDQGEAYNRMGYVYAELGRWNEAAEAFQKYAFLYPKEANPHDSLGELYLRTGQYREAEAEFERALSLKDDFIWARDHLAMIYEDQGRYRDALRETRRVQEMLHGTTDAYPWKLYEISLELESGNREEALALARALNAEHCTDPDYHHLLGRIYAGMNRAGETAAELKILVALQEERLRERGEDSSGAASTFAALELAADVDRARGEWAAAADGYARAAEAEAWRWWSVRRARVKQMECLIRAGRPEAVLPVAREVLAENPRHAQTLCWMARALEAAGRPQAAEVPYRTALEVLRRADPGNPYRAEAAAKVGALAQDTAR